MAPPMLRIRNHLIKSFIAGIVALLPIGGLVLTVGYFENQVAGVWLKKQGFYFFGLGLLLATVAVYLVGLMVTTFVGRWLWDVIDRLLHRLPVLGNLYATLKQILGYGDGPGGMFQRVVLVPVGNEDRYELGLVTGEPSSATQDQLVVFVPSAPTPTSGRLIFIEPRLVKPSSLTPSQAMQKLVSLGAISD
jgi:uncharacterized membrane protein